MSTPPSCPLCPDGTPHASDAFNDEHVIPARIGGTFVVRTHEECNLGAARWVDNPLMAVPDIDILRGLYIDRNTRTGGRVRGSQRRGELLDGAPALLKSTPEGMVIEQVARGDILPGDEEGEFTVTLPPMNIERHTEKLVTALQEQHPGKKIEFKQERRWDHATIEYSSSLVPYTWPRFAAKVGLCALSEVMPQEWRGSDGDLFLQALFRRGLVYGAPNGLAALPTELGPGDALYDLLKPSEHVIQLIPGDGKILVHIVLFGELQYGIAVATDIEPDGPLVWVCDPGTKRPVRLSNSDAFLVALFERAEMFGPTTGLRHDRPHGRSTGPGIRARIQEDELPGAG